MKNEEEVGTIMEVPVVRVCRFFGLWKHSYPPKLNIGNEIKGPIMSEKIRCSHILVQKESTAKEVIEKINKGESFAKLAEQYSIDGTRKKGGDLGFFKRGAMVKEFDKASFALKKGEVSGIVKTQYGFHIIKRTE